MIEVYCEKCGAKGISINCTSCDNLEAQVELLKKDLKIAKAVAENNARTLIREINEQRKIIDLLENKK